MNRLVFYIILPLANNAMLSEDENVSHPKVVGGVAVDLDKFPHSARFYNDDAMCAGVILSSWSVLTSAHCIDRNDDVQLMAVVVGSQSLTDYGGQWFGVTKVIVHEKYNTTVQFECDLAILFVDDMILFGRTVQRVILVNNDKWMHAKHTTFYVSGWGHTSYHGKVSPQLLMTTLQYVNQSQCEKLNGIKLSPEIFCLYGAGERDACKGDSGGGVMWNRMLVGLTSHGNGGCSRLNKPTMFANVWYLREWIRKQVNLFMEECMKV